MSLIQKLINKLRRPRPEQTPDIPWREDIVIQTPDGPIPEKWRRQAIINMRLDPVKFREVEAIVLRECGGDWEKCRARMRASYPEALPEGY